MMGKSIPGSCPCKGWGPEPAVLASSMCSWAFPGCCRGGGLGRGEKKDRQGKKMEVPIPMHRSLDLALTVKAPH